MTNYPKHWDTATLGELCLEVRNGIAAKPDREAGIPILRISAVRPMRLDTRDTRYLPAGFKGADLYALRNGDLLFTRYNGNRDLVGACALVGQVSELLVYPDKLIRVRLDAELAHPAFVEKVVASSGARSFLFDKLKTSAGQVGIAGADLKRLPIPLPPLREQRRIADELDSLLARVDACRERLNRVPLLIARLRQSILEAATNGELTADWRDSAAGRGEWQRSSIGAVATDLRYGTSKKCDYRGIGTPVLRIPNIGNHGALNLVDLKRSDFDESEVSRLALKPDDLLVIRSNGSVDLVGKPGLVGPDAAGMLFAGYLMRLRVDARIALPRFVLLSLESPVLRQEIELTSKSTSGVNNLNAEELRGMPLMLPSTEEQAEIVRRVDSLFILTDSIESKWKSARKQVDGLTPAILAKAFRGELVPQDPNDEPASASLARIRAARATPCAAERP